MSKALRTKMKNDTYIKTFYSFVNEYDLRQETFDLINNHLSKKNGVVAKKAAPTDKAATDDIPLMVVQGDLSVEATPIKRRPGRPRKVEAATQVQTIEVPKRGRGRPKKLVATPVETEILNPPAEKIIAKGKAGRPMTGKALKDVRKKLSLNQAQMGAKLGLSQAMICQMEKGNMKMSDEVVNQVKTLKAELKQ